MSAGRQVVLICGPPGAGKTTLAHTLGLPVYDLDDPQWANNRQFNRALDQLGRTLNAQAAVIRSNATLAARAKTAAQIQATDVRLILTPEDECIRRAITRNRPRPTIAQQIAAIHQWWTDYEPDTMTSVRW